MMTRGKKSWLSLLVCSLLFLAGCNNGFTSSPISPILQPLIAQAPPAEGTIISQPLTLAVAWVQPADGEKVIPDRAKDSLLDQVHKHFSASGMALKVEGLDTVTSVDLATLQKLGQKYGVSHMLVLAPTVQEIVVPEKFGFSKSGFWLGSRTECQVYLETVAIELTTGLPIFKAQANGQAALEELEYGAFNPYPRIFRGFHPPGGSVYYPEGEKEEFPPHEVRVVASNYAMAGLLWKLDRIEISATASNRIGS